MSSDDSPNIRNAMRPSLPQMSVHNMAALEARQQKQKDAAAAGGDGDDDAAEEHALHVRLWRRWQSIYASHSFLILVVIAILLAYAYPPLGAIYLAPQITATWIAVMFIFVLAGMGIKTEEFAKAFRRLKFNLFLQLYNFGAVSGIVYGFSRLMVRAGALPPSLGDGMIICASLPITVNMVLVLTKSAGGDEASAIFNAAFGNLAGVFLSPALILAYLGVRGTINLGDVFFKLGLRVVLPIAVGQVLQKFVPLAREFVKRYKKYFKKAQEMCLVFIVYTVFCKTFHNGSDANAGDVFLMIAMQLVMLLLVMALAWITLGVLFGDEPKLRAMGLFGCTHKTVAMGVPLINAIYEDNPLVGMYTLPLLIWHPMQLVLGTAVAPRVAAYVERRERELMERQRDAIPAAAADAVDDDEGVGDVEEQQGQPPEQQMKEVDVNSDKSPDENTHLVELGDTVTAPSGHQHAS